MTSLDTFPLAAALAQRLRPELDALVGGEPNELLPNVTSTTAELLRFWFQQEFCELRPLNFHTGQRDAILAVIYAHEVCGPTNLQDLYQELAPSALLEEGVLSEVAKPLHSHPKYAAKMATGSGKTWVLNALLVWQFLNRAASPDDERFTNNFLVVAPGLIVYDRLLDSFLGKEREGQREFESSDIFSHRSLFVPDDYRDAVFGFVQSSVATKEEIGRKTTGGGLIAITNWHLLAGVEDPDFVPDSAVPGADLDPKEIADSVLPLPPGSGKGNALLALDRRYQRGGPLEALRDLPSLVVFNDEAHHIHEVKRGGEVTEVEWQKSLTEIASTKGRQFVQIDFSATPYNQVGSGRSSRKEFFPHIVVDFDLNSAMRRGLVKLLALDKRKEVAALPLDFSAERDENGRVVGLSQGQRVMLNAGLKRLGILEEHFARVDPEKFPKLLVVCEDTNVTPHVEEYLQHAGLASGDILVVDSNRKGEMRKADWDVARERLFDIDRHAEPKVVVSVLMLREGFDVNNICVVVPLRSTEASILLEQTVGRGLRLMWRGDEQIDDLKRETRDRLRAHLEPNNYFDVLFVVEHPRFTEFYDALVEDGLAGEVDESGDTGSATGDLVMVELRDDYHAFDFGVPIIARDALEELGEPSLDPLSLRPSKYPFDLLKKTIGSGDVFVAEDAQHGTQYGDYRVDGGIMTATGYNDYLSRMTRRVSEALGSKVTKSAKTYSAAAAYPFLQAYRPQLAGWLDQYIRHALFGQTIDPLADENWRVLLIDDVAHGIAGVFATALTEIAENQVVGSAAVTHRWLSETRSIPVRKANAVAVSKSIYPSLPVPARAGGLERMFMEWADADSTVEALAKIHEHRHPFLHRPYLKADGMPAIYSPDFLVRTASDTFVVETKAQSALSDENVQRKARSALTWVDQINSLDDRDRGDRTWHYVLLSETTARQWRDLNARATEVLDFARLREPDGAAQESLDF